MKWVAAAAVILVLFGTVPAHAEDTQDLVEREGAVCSRDGVVTTFAAVPKTDALIFKEPGNESFTICAMLTRLQSAAFSADGERVDAVTEVREGEKRYEASPERREDGKPCWFVPYEAWTDWKPFEYQCRFRFSVRDDAGALVPRQIDDLSTIAWVAFGRGAERHRPCR